MRQVTKSIVGVVSLGVLATSWALGQASDTNSFNSNYAGVATGTASPSPSSPSPSSPSPSSPSPAVSSTPAPTRTKTPSSATVTKTGDAQNYRYGVIQLSVTKSGGAITSVSLLQAGATGGRQAAFDPLVNAALQAQGSNFGNLSNATYTTEAFKTALESALAKF